MSPSRPGFPRRILLDWTRVVTTSITATWLGALLLFQAIDAFENLRDYTAGGADGGQILVFFLLRSPEIAVQILPAAILIGALVGLFRLARTHETTAAEAAGMHPAWIYTVPLSLAAIATLLQLGLEGGPLPLSRALATDYAVRHIEGNPLKARQDIRWVSADQALWRIEVRDAAVPDYDLERYTADADAGISVVRIKGLRQASARSGDWLADHVELRRFPPLHVTTSTLVPPIPFLPEELAPQPPRPDERPMPELWAAARAKRQLAEDADQLWLDLHRRLAWPWLNMTVLLAAMPFIPRHGRRASLAAGVLVALVLGLAGWALVVLGQAWATTHRSPPGFWLPHGALVLTGTLLSVRTWWQRRKHR